MANLVVGENDLATVNPKLANEWNYKKNGDLKPADVTVGSGKKVWWMHSLSDGSTHEWQATIASRCDGHDCPYCSNVRVFAGFNDLASKSQLLANEWNYEKNDLFPSEVLATSNKKVWWRCAKGHEWQAAIASRMAGRGCPYCANKKVLAGFNDLATSNPKLAQQWNHDRNGNLTPQDVVCGSSKKVWWRCPKCGHEWKASINNRNRGAGCPRCSHPSKRKSHDQYVCELNKKNPNIKAIGIYRTIKDPIKCRCKVCGFEWLPNAGSILSSGRGCPRCWSNRRKQPRKTEAEFSEQLNKVNSEIALVSRYKSSKKKVRCRCKICGHEWSVMPGSLLAGEGCPRCNHSQTSFAEQCLYFALALRLGKDHVISRDRMAVGMELDVYVPEKKVAFEYGAWVWHKNRIDRDREKRKKCGERSIRLIQCYDGFPSSENPPFDTDCLIYQQSLGINANRKNLVEYLNRCLVYVGEPNLTEDELKSILANGYRNSRRKTTSQFVEELSEISPDIEVIGDYESSTSKIEVRCRNCGKIWFAAPNNLLGGTGCPNCKVKANAANRTLSQAEFCRKLASANPRIELVGQYRKAHIKVEVKCKVCGHTWFAVPSSLLRGVGCPKCRGRAHGKVICLETGDCFDTFSAAAKWCGLKGCGGISAACKTRGGYAGGYHWAFAQVD